MMSAPPIPDSRSGDVTSAAVSIMEPHPLRRPNLTLSPAATASVARIVTCILLIVIPAMAGVIFWRWATVREPSSAVVIAGDISLDGARVEISNSKYHFPPVVLDRTNDWQTPILLDPGTYQVTVSHRGQLILDDTFKVKRFAGFRYDLRSMVWIIGNNTLADASIVIEAQPPLAEVSPVRIKFTARNHFQTPAYLAPGDYEISAWTFEAVPRLIARKEFVVDRTAVVRVDLNRDSSFDPSMSPP